MFSKFSTKNGYPSNPKCITTRINIFLVWRFVCFCRFNFLFWPPARGLVIFGAFVVGHNTDATGGARRRCFLLFFLAILDDVALQEFTAILYPALDPLATMNSNKARINSEKMTFLARSHKKQTKTPAKEHLFCFLKKNKKEVCLSACHTG